ncbi:MAG TPA: circadian clock KaiB family protein [Polyangiaceae bacterium]|jgi:circadian clock protein KaiB|nr:circadian clock KaiB family protein [Polyangiaceae bacterium]
MKRVTDSTDAFERAGAGGALARYDLRLYVAGATRQSSAAIRNIQALCEARLSGRYELEVIDIYQHPGRAKDDQVLALPTLIRRRPLPWRQLVGDLSDIERVLRGLDILDLAPHAPPKPSTPRSIDAKEALPRKARRR